MSERRTIIEVVWKNPSPDNDAHVLQLTKQIAERINKKAEMYEIHLFVKPEHWS